MSTGNNLFYLKNLKVQHHLSPMKIGTDALLLGAIPKQIQSGSKILEIGSGCGIITLMMAGKYPEASYTCVEIDAQAVEESQLNFVMNGLDGNCSTIKDNIINFADNYTSGFDVIVSNPPFFTSGMKPESKALEGAKHTTTLSIASLASSVYSLLNKNGLFYVILPPAEGICLKDHLSLKGMNLIEKWEVKSMQDTPVIRNILTFQKCEQPENFILKQFYIYRSGERNDWSDQYKELLQDFKIF